MLYGLVCDAEDGEATGLDRGTLQNIGALGDEPRTKTLHKWWCAELAGTPPPRRCSLL